MTGLPKTCVISIKNIIFNDFPTVCNKNQKEEFSLAINRPFLSIIRDNQTGNILFIGMIFEP